MHAYACQNRAIDKAYPRYSLRVSPWTGMPRIAILESEEEVEMYEQSKKDIEKLDEYAEYFDLMKSANRKTMKFETFTEFNLKFD